MKTVLFLLFVFLLLPVLFSLSFPLDASITSQSFDYKGYSFNFNVYPAYRVFDSCGELGDYPNVCAQNGAVDDVVVVGSKTYSCFRWNIKQTQFCIAKCQQYRCSDAKTGGSVSRWSDYSYECGCGGERTIGGIQTSLIGGCSFDFSVTKDGEVFYSSLDLAEDEGVQLGIDGRFPFQGSEGHYLAQNNYRIGFSDLFCLRILIKIERRIVVLM